MVLGVGPLSVGLVLGVGPTLCESLLYDTKALHLHLSYTLWIQLLALQLRRASHDRERVLPISATPWLPQRHSHGERGRVGDGGEVHPARRPPGPAGHSTLRPTPRVPDRPTRHGQDSRARPQSSGMVAGRTWRARCEHLGREPVRVSRHRLPDPGNGTGSQEPGPPARVRFVEAAQWRGDGRGDAGGARTARRRSACHHWWSWTRLHRSQKVSLQGCVTFVYIVNMLVCSTGWVRVVIGVKQGDSGRRSEPAGLIN